VRACGEELKVTVSESGACKRSLVSNPTPSQRPRHLVAER
jgi:hypothetical protein